VPTPRRFSRSQRRSSTWEKGPKTGVDGASIAISASAISIAASGQESLTDGLTLIRTRGQFSAFITKAALSGDGFSGAFGIGMANEKAFTTGSGSLLTPVTDDDWEGWIYHRYFQIYSGGQIEIATAANEALQVNSVCAGVQYEVDSKAMRKWEENSTVYAAVEVVEQGTDSVMEWSFNCRLLAKLP